MPSTNLDHPNVVVILTDDQGCWAMGCAGNGELRTPNLDRLAAAGMRFENLFCASPVCSPARASLLTGRIPSQHGVHDWIRAGNSPSEPDKGGRLTEYLAGLTGYTEILATQGYTCGMSGKWHLGDSVHPQKAFSFWEVHARGGGPYYDAPMISKGAESETPGYVTDVITDNALRFLGDQEEEHSPFYLSVHYTAPHSPWDRGNHPDAVYDDYYDNCPFESTPFLPMHPWQVNSAPQGTDEERRRELLSGYYAAVEEMDRNVGRILDRLEAMGVRENTIIFFTSDNGMNMGHHGIYGKGNGTFPQNMYDTSVKVPGLISRPGHIPEGVISQAIISHYDFMPTLIDYLGMWNPTAVQLPGRSFAPLLRGEKGDERDAIVVYDEYGPVRMIRNREWKYVHRYPYGPHELYHLADDPDEETNLTDAEEHAGIRTKLRAQLEAWFVRYVDPARDGTKEPVTGKGQLGLCGPAAQGEENFAGDWFYLHDGTKIRRRG
jgi:choline-sulfatase